MLAEANVGRDESREYFGETATACSMMFNFPVNQRLFWRSARENAEPLSDALRSAAAGARSTASGRSSCAATTSSTSGGSPSSSARRCSPRSAPSKPEMQLYGRGIRRRLAPMLGNDRRRLELAYSLMFSLPGTPMIRYGDEIGMGDDLSLPERLAVRTPMQWSNAANAGFSMAAPKRLVRPVIAKGEFAYEKVNVQAQIYDAGSLLNRMQRLIRARRSCPEIGNGETVLIDTDRVEVLAHACCFGGREMIAVHNLSGKDCKVGLKRDAEGSTLLDLQSDQPYPPVDGPIALGPYGYRWFRVDRRASLRRP